MTTPARTKALVIGVARSDHPWWWKHVDRETLACDLHYWTIPLDGGRPSSPFSVGFMWLVIRATRALVRASRDGYDYIITFENDWLTFIVAGLRTLRIVRQPRQVIVQFIMREKIPTLKSRLKYAFMRWCFSSVHLCICSSRSEMKYYESVFAWPSTKLAFVPFHTDPVFIDAAGAPEERGIVSAGRTFRDYQTLFEAVEGTDLSVTVVAGRSSLDGAAIPRQVAMKYDVPLKELTDLIARSMIVVLPLRERQISTGQSVLLEAMAMGKPVVATRVNGTVDYIEHMATGLLVPPNDPQAMRNALMLLAGDVELRHRLGNAARREVLRQYLPNHYAQGVSRALRGRQ